MYPEASDGPHQLAPVVHVPRSPARRASPATQDEATPWLAPWRCSRPSTGPGPFSGGAWATTSRDLRSRRRRAPNNRTAGVMPSLLDDGQTRPRAVVPSVARDEKRGKPVYVRAGVLGRLCRADDFTRRHQNPTSMTSAPGDDRRCGALTGPSQAKPCGPTTAGTRVRCPPEFRVAGVAQMVRAAAL